MDVADNASGAGSAYVLGHTAGELRRLAIQASLIDPITRRFVGEGGVREGMRVLDIGSGGGHVAFLVADLVGSAGTVVGVDQSPTAVEAARAGARARSLGNVEFQAGDPAEMVFDQPFDAVVGRYVLHRVIRGPGEESNLACGRGESLGPPHPVRVVAAFLPAHDTCDWIDGSSRRYVLHPWSGARYSGGRAQWLYLAPKVPGSQAGPCRSPRRDRQGNDENPQWSDMRPASNNHQLSLVERQPWVVAG